jgi:hypothetical protein
MLTTLRCYLASTENPTETRNEMYALHTATNPELHHGNSYHPKLGKCSKRWIPNRPHDRHVRFLRQRCIRG